MILPPPAPADRGHAHPPAETRNHRRWGHIRPPPWGQVGLTHSSASRSANRGVVLGAVIMMLVGNPLSGLTSAPEVLPAGWGAFGQLLPLGAIGQLLGSAAYFGGAGSSGHLVVLTCWIAAGLLLLALADRRRAAAAPAGSKVAAPGAAESPVVPAPRRAFRRAYPRRGPRLLRPPPPPAAVQDAGGRGKRQKGAACSPHRISPRIRVRLPPSALL